MSYDDILLRNYHSPSSIMDPVRAPFVLQIALVLRTNPLVSSPALLRHGARRASYPVPGHVLADAPLQQTNRVAAILARPPLLVAMGRGLLAVLCQPDRLLYRRVDLPLPSSGQLRQHAQHYRTTALYVLRHSVD